MEQPDGHLDRSGDGYFKYVSIPPGAYLVEFLAYLPANEALFDARGGAARFRVPGRSRGVLIGQYFRKTRPNEPLPDWLTAHLLDFPEHDPGHEEVWRNAEDDVEFENHLLYVIRLTPVPSGQPMPRRPRKLWLPFELRTLPKCPLGLPPPSDRN
ncbi:MAG: hypothetical protein ACRC1K_11765 [Planctomycetia bacterium]